MRVAVVGSRQLKVDNLEKFLPSDVTEIVSGGARGVDTSAADYAKRNGLKLTVFLPDYNQYGRSAPIRRNVDIINNSDLVLAFWDGASRGTRFVIEYCRKHNVPVRIFKPVK